MSYEGFSQLLCKYGHYWLEDCYNIDDFTHQVCPRGHHAIWENMVNTTNGSFDDKGTRIDGYRKLALKKTKKCRHCGTVLEERYKIPTCKQDKKEMTKLKGKMK